MDPTRKDAGQQKLVVTISLDLLTSLTSVETNIMDPSVMLRIVGQGMQLWSNDLMKKQAAMFGKGPPKRPLVLPSPTNKDN